MEREIGKLQIGKWGEYLFAMQFMRMNLDVYAPLVDDRGIDFVLRKAEPLSYWEVQVKSVRLTQRRPYSYVFFRKKHFVPRESLLVSLAVFEESKNPKLYLIPSMRWTEPDGLFKDYDYGGARKSAPEFGLNVSLTTLHELDRYRVEKSAVASALIE